MAAMNELESVKQSLEQIARSNAEGAVWRAKADEWRTKTEASLAEAATWRAKAEASLAEAAAWRAVADKRHVEAEAADKAFKKELAELTRTMRDTRKEVGGITNTRGRTTEELFFQALNKDRRLGKLKFRHIHTNVRGCDDDREAEFDMLMTNGQVVAVIEIKHKLRCEDVERMRKWTLPDFRRLMPEYDDKALAPAMACIIAQREALALAYKYGYAVLRPGGQQLHVNASHLRCLPKRRKTPAR